MNTVEIPENFRNILDILRAGKIDLGLEQLEEIKGFEPQKAIVKAEINYFKSNYEIAMGFDEQALPFDEQWYAGNILFEHLFAYSNAAILSNSVKRAENFLKQYLAEKEKLGLPENRLNVYKHQISQHLKKLYGEKNLIIDIEPLQIIKEGQTKEKFIAQLKKFRPKLGYDSVEGAEYLLYFMFEKGNTKETLDYYRTYSDKIRNEDHHINAGRLYLKMNQIEESKQAILRFVSKAWYPVENIQVLPMRIWTIEDLYPILTTEFKKKILLIQKAKE